MYACICVVHAFRFEMFLKFRPLLIFYLCPFKFWFHVFASSYACWCCCWRQSGCLVGWLAVIPYGDDMTAGIGFPGGCRLRWRCWLIDFDGVTSSWRIRKYTQMEFCDFFYANKHTYLYTYIHTYKHTYIPIISINMQMLLVLFLFYLSFTLLFLLQKTYCWFPLVTPTYFGVFRGVFARFVSSLICVASMTKLIYVY